MKHKRHRLDHDAERIGGEKKYYTYNIMETGGDLLYLQTVLLLLVLRGISKRFGYATHT